MKKIKNNDIEKNVLNLAAINATILGMVITLSPKMFLGFFSGDFFVIANLLDFWHLYGIALVSIGIGYFIAAKDPEKYWQFILVGFIFNLCSSYFFIKSYIQESLPVSLLSILLFSCIVWVVPFYLILVNAFNQRNSEINYPSDPAGVLKYARTSFDENLLALSYDKNILLVFVREFGCAFCKETVHNIAKNQQLIKDKKLDLVFVHMSDKEDADLFFSKYFTENIRHISDPSRSLYRSFNLKRGKFNDIYGVKTFIKSLYLMFFKGHGPAQVQGDDLQLGGAFLLSRGGITFEDKADSRDHGLVINKLNQIEVL